MNKKKIKKELLEDFDFEKAHEIMELLNWKWTLLGCVPNSSQIKDAVSKLIDSFLDDKECLSLSSGGFSLRRSCELNDGEYDSVILTFEALREISFINQ